MSLAQRAPALVALALPVLAGLGYMAWAGAPQTYLLANFAALVLGLGWIAFGRAPHWRHADVLVLAVLGAIMALPLVTGPYVLSVTNDPVARWLPLGPVTLNTGMLALPLACVIAARQPALAAPVLLAALFGALLQPDGAAGFAITFAAVGLHHVTRDWKVGLVVIVAFFAAIMMSLRGELPPQPFVERVLVDAASANIAVALGLALALAASFLLILFASLLSRAERFALAGALFGFGIMALMSHYPTPLIGHGAAPILGFAVALGWHRSRA